MKVKVLAKFTTARVQRNANPCGVLNSEKEAGAEVFNEKKHKETDTRADSLSP